MKNHFDEGCRGGYYYAIPGGIEVIIAAAAPSGYGGFGTSYPKLNEVVHTYIIDESTPEEE